jgi:hypothetical protein
VDTAALIEDMREVNEQVAGDYLEHVVVVRRSIVSMSKVLEWNHSNYLSTWFNRTAISTMPMWGFCLIDARRSSGMMALYTIFGSSVSDGLVLAYWRRI